MHFNGETWLRILILLFGLIVSVSCLRGSELILQAAKAKNAATAKNATSTEGVVSDAEGTNSTTGEKSLLTGIPQIDYIHDPNLPRELNGFNLSDYPFYNSIPADIDFKCDGLHDGFYASVPHHCQVYHHCLYGIRYDFLCANYTAFDQKTFICHFVSEVDCNNSPKYYQRNEALYKAVTSAPVIIKTTTTKATTEAPKKQEEESRRPGLFRPRRPPYRRRPSYEYYDNAEDYYDDYYYYDPPARKRPGRNKGYRGDYYGGERAGHKNTHRESPRRKPLKPLYEEEEEDYEYYYDSVDGSKDDDNRRRPLDNNYRKPIDRDRPYLNKKRDKDIYNRDRNDKKKRTEDDYGNSRKSDEDRRLRNKYKGLNQRSKYDRDEEDLDDFDNSRRYQDDKRDKYLKNRPDASKRIPDSDKPLRSKSNKSTTPYPDEYDYEDIAATPKWKSRFQQRRPVKEDSLKKPEYNTDELEESNNKKVQQPKETNKDSKSQDDSGLPTFNPQIYARQPSKLYSQVKVETRPPPVQRNKNLYKADLPATTMSSYRRPANIRSGLKDKGFTESERPKIRPKYTTPITLDIDDYEDDSVIDDTVPAKSYYEEEVSETYHADQYPSKPTTTVQQPKNYREQSTVESQPKNGQRNKSVFSQRFKPANERQTTAPVKQQTTEKLPTKPPVTESQFIPYQPPEETQSGFYLKQQVTERQPLPYSKPAISERQPQTYYQRPPYSERQLNSERASQVEKQPLPVSQPLSERQIYSERQPQLEKQQVTVPQPLPERQIYSERQPQMEKQPLTVAQPLPERQALSEKPVPERHQYFERQPLNERPVTERQQFLDKQPYLDKPVAERQPLPERQHLTERQPYSERQSYSERQPLQERQQFVERQPLPFPRQPVTERLLPYQRQPVTDRQIIAYVKQPVTDRQLIPFKQIVTERQILPFIRQPDLERRPIPFPKQPPRTFEITAPGPSGLGGRIEVSDTVQRDKYLIQGDRPTGFSIRLPQSDYSSPLLPSPQLQRKPEDQSPEKVVTRPSFKPVRSFRAKPTPDTQFHDNVRLETIPQRYITRTENYETVAAQNPRLPVIPQISHVSSAKEWYW